MNTYEVSTAKEKTASMIRYDQVITHHEMLKILVGKGLTGGVKGE